jgi:hypothetical protein
MDEPPQGYGDLVRLLATIERLVARVQRRDPARAAVGRELLAKLAPYGAPRVGGAPAAAPPGGTVRC